ncbi:carboxy terminal-processing peptidase [uncultured Mucilaginibacter sp.]|uniref:carboxy terminal-processing peptidase n=1 Tax=uncultured Mucilaginibacter sp. TaxID=797541 RepID=UPI0025E03EB9|nr:carboxy terminal-processing peptidase [uncultured Mucilaginibacter sp.]
MNSVYTTIISTPIYFFISFILGILQAAFYGMKKLRAALFTLLFLPTLSNAQTTDRVANEAFVITRMVNKFHVEPRQLNASFSADVFKGMLDKADEDRIFFTQNDIGRLNPYRAVIAGEIKQRNTAYLDLFISIYKQRLRQADSLADFIVKTPFNFYAVEKLTVAEDTLFPAAPVAMRPKLYKKLKANALDELDDDIPDDFKTWPAVKQKKYIDSAGLAAQKKVVSSLKRKIGNILQNSYGIERYLGNLYCETIASCFDPHTEFFPPQEKENFESELGKQPFQFGFRMKEDKNGGVLIDNLEPGSPAYKSGKLNKGDKFMSLQWDGRKAVDVSDISPDDFIELIRQSGHNKVLFTMKKTDGPIVQLTLEREQVAAGGGEDDGRVKSFVLKGKTTVGYIYLPAFYEDWESNNEGLNGCANDVGREIIKLKKENISGLILDLRSNGGGSVGEATELAGIFIDAGPVAQVKSKDEKVATIKDTDRGTVFDGPLVIMVNGYSASASEMVAGTLQDYNRAVIIGSPTYGKATMQVVLPMDTTITPENFSKVVTEDNLKLTVSKLYRVTGASAQFKGVQPDIALPDMLDVYISKEADEPFALRSGSIAPNKYYTPYAPLPLKTLAQSMQTEIDTSQFFNMIKKLVAYTKQQKAAKDIPLNINDYLALNMANNAGTTAPLPPLKKFIVQSNADEQERLQANSLLKEMNEDFSKRVAADAYISIAYDVLAKMKTE